MNYFVSLETDNWEQRGKKVRCFRKKYISKKEPELNELKQTVLLK